MSFTFNSAEKHSLWQERGSYTKLIYVILICVHSLENIIWINSCCELWPTYCVNRQNIVLRRSGSRSYYLAVAG